MKISRTWLQTWFTQELPDVKTLADTLTFHAFEIDGIENEVLDVKVTPNRGHDCLSYRGIAKEVSAILQLPLKTRSEFDISKKTDAVSITLSTELCKRFTAAYIKGVQVAPSPQWLTDALEKQGQRSINNVVDITNYVMFSIGQPLHAFDAGQLQQKDGTYAFEVRAAREKEVMLALDDKEYVLSSSHLVVSDTHTNTAVGIAGVKGGKPAGITTETKDIIIECANFDGPSVRKTSRALNLRTDASQRFEQVISPEMTLWSMRDAVALILELAGGEFIGVADEYPQRQMIAFVSVTLSRINSVLGASLAETDVSNVLSRLGFSFELTGTTWRVAIPPERLDITIEEDLIEEVGRVIGYESITALSLPVFEIKPEMNVQYYKAQKVREYLVAQGFSEVVTSVFVDSGERVVLNKVDGVRPYLRTSLKDGLVGALERNVRTKEILGLPQIKLFEIGTVWSRDSEEISIDIAVEKVKKQKTEEEYRRELDVFVSSLEQNRSYPVLPPTTTERYAPFSKYPYIVRDIALWVPSEMSSEAVAEKIRHAAGDLLVRFDQFDRFEKEGKVSYAFRLVFQSFDRTLFDEDANHRMESVYDAVKKEGWEVR